MIHTSSLLLSIPPSFSEQLRQRTNGLRSRIVRVNYNTRFAQTAPELTEFCRATAGSVDGVGDGFLSELFQKTVHLTTYDSYAPFLASFSEKPCKASAIIDLFSPGLPDFVAESSSTSSGIAKMFLKYNYLAQMKSSDSGSWTVSDTLRRRTAARICYLGCDKVNVVDEANGSVKTIYLACSAVIGSRISLNLDPEKDGEKMATFILDHAAPYATGFIKKWRSFLLIHALFAVGSRALETMSMIFINTFVDMMRHLDMEFDMVVECIANGTIPDLDGIADVRHYLESCISADPDRAAELRRIGRPSSLPGWCSHIWPNLRSVTGVASGSFASSVPLAQWFLGPNVALHSLGYASTESMPVIALPYNPLELNQFKVPQSTIVEFLDVDKNDSIDSLAQPWEVEPGRRYEVVLTTQDGLWRYRLGDVVEISGFDPIDGVPVIQFVGRHNVAIRFPDFMVSEKELMEAMSSVPPNMLSKVVYWTATIDDRYLPATIGLFVELDDQGMYGFPRVCFFAHDSHFSLDVGLPVSDLETAPERVLDELIRSNGNIAWALEHDVFRKPTIRLVRSGTFSDFRQLKLDEGSDNLGQVKVPVVLSNAAYVTWFSDRVVREL